MSLLSKVINSKLSKMRPLLTVFLSLPHYAQIGLWLVLSFLYTDVLPDSSDWAQLGTPAQHSVSPWPVVGDNGELHLCQANLTYTAPAGPASAVVDCVDYTCSATSSLTV